MVVSEAAGARARHRLDPKGDGSEGPAAATDDDGKEPIVSDISALRQTLERELKELETARTEIPVRIKVTRKLITSLEAFEAATNGKETAEKKFLCPDCHKKFQNPSGLGSHRSRVHGVKGVSRS